MKMIVINMRETEWALHLHFLFNYFKEYVNLEILLTDFRNALDTVNSLEVPVSTLPFYPFHNDVPCSKVHTCCV